ncbi:MAG: amidohydrolase, partial [Deltaproteobacteria bacterium]|nr:amidohydrolase [Deltaproteobacteria bacterium]
MNDKEDKICRRSFLKATSLAATGGLLLGSDVIAWAAKNDTVPDAIYFNGKIVTLDPAGSIVSGVAVKDGKILKVGSADEIKKLAGSSTRLVDLGGKTVVPGLI